MAELELLSIATPGGGTKRHAIFVHGLGGDLRKTWTSPPPPPPKERLWPTWLASDIEALSVWSIGYEAPISEWRGLTMDLAARAENVLSLLEIETGLADGELIFIGHSLGGLVIKQLLRKASDASSQRPGALSLIERTRKVVFLATPHLGADLAGWGDGLRRIVRPSAATRILLRNDPHLRDLNLWYRRWATEREIAHLILYETKATSFFGMLVKPDSSDPGLLFDPIGIETDHFGIVQPPNPKNQIYKLVRSFIERGVARSVTQTERKVDAVKDVTTAISEQQRNDSAKLDELLALAHQSGVLQRSVEQGIPEPAVRAIVERLGGLDLSPDDLIPWLDRWTLEAARERSNGTNEGEAFERAFEKAQGLFNSGRIDEASSPFMDELARRRDAEKLRREENKRRELRLVEEAIKFDKLAFNGEAAVAKLRVMAEIEGATTIDAIGKYLFEKADEFYEIGNKAGDNAALIVAIAAYRAALEERTRDRVPFDWAMTQSNLGAALKALGAHESGTARLKEAIAAYRAALNELTRESTPFEWAVTEVNFGSALRLLGEREEGTANLEGAVVAIGAALKILTRERAPFEWGAAQANLGNALRMLGEREENRARLKEAAAAFRAALEERTRDRSPFEWAKTQVDLGSVLARLGEAEREAANLEDAIDAFRAALNELTRDRSPFEWATTHCNLGNALFELGKRRSGTLHLEQAITAYRVALEVLTRQRYAQGWATTQMALGNALSSLGMRDRQAGHLEQMISAYRAAQEEWTQESSPHLHAIVQRNYSIGLVKIFFVSPRWWLFRTIIIRFLAGA